MKSVVQVEEARAVVEVCGIEYVSDVVGNCGGESGEVVDELGVGVGR